MHGSVDDSIAEHPNWQVAKGGHHPLAPSGEIGIEGLALKGAERADPGRPTLRGERRAR
jgi:hypothetical protein